MQITDGDLFGQDCNAIALPTNGYVTSSLTLVMGAGIARRAADIWPNLPDLLGLRVYQQGNAVHCITINKPDYNSHNIYLGGQNVPYHIISFPTKPTKVNIKTKEDLTNVLLVYKQEAEALLANTNKDMKWLPGWKAKSDLNLIKHSCEELVELTDQMKWKKVCLPRVGCGNGGLEWTKVAELLRKHLDHRFTVVNRQ